eukprot:Rhum_TRINITY_DN12402_c0_g1::Rhum_TRINITY_DN12402_c0_g1_i3::g.52149::m.52149
MTIGSFELKRAHTFAELQASGGGGKVGTWVPVAAWGFGGRGRGCSWWLCLGRGLLGLQLRQLRLKLLDAVDGVLQARLLRLALHEALGLHPVVIDELRQVVADAVGEQDDATLALLQPLGGDARAVHGAARRSTDKQTLLLDQVTRVLQRRHVRGHHPLVDEAPVEHVRDEVVADALHLVERVLLALDELAVPQDRAGGVHADDDQVRQLLLQELGHARDGASGARTDDDHVELAVALVVDLLRRAVVVRLDVVPVHVLVEHVHVLRVRVAHAVRHRDVRLVGVEGRVVRRADDVGAEGRDDAALLLAHLHRHGHNHLEAAHGARQRHANAGVARRGLDARVALLELALLLSLQHHAAADAVLHGATRVVELALRKHLALQAEVLRHAVQAHQRRVADKVEDGVRDARDLGQVRRVRLGGGRHAVWVWFFFGLLSWESE